MKKQVFFSLVAMLSMLGALTGCGKSKNAASTAPVGSYAYSYNGTAGSGGCAQFPVTAGALSMPITGQAQIGISGFSSQTSVGGSGLLPGANRYVRTNFSGDIVDISLAGTANSAGTVGGVVTLSAQTVQALGGNLVPLCIQGVVFQNTGITAGTPGSLYGGIVLYATSQYGQFTLGL